MVELWQFSPWLVATFVVDFFFILFSFGLHIKDFTLKPVPLRHCPHLAVAANHDDGTPTQTAQLGVAHTR